MKGKLPAFAAGMVLGLTVWLLGGCLKPKAPRVTVREPATAAEAVIAYTPPPEPHFSAEFVTNYLPMIRQMINPKVEKVSEDVYVAMGYALGNVVMIRTDEGLVIIDGSDNVEVAGKILADFRKITPLPVRYLILTHFHPDHTGGARAFAGPGVEVIATQDFLSWINYQNELLAEHHRRSRTIQSGNAAPEYAFAVPLLGRSPVQVDRQKKPDVPAPTIVFKDSYAFTLGGKRFELFHTRGETEDHLAVWMPDEKILFPADLYYHSFPNLSTPMLEARPVQGWIDSLTRFIGLGAEIMVPQHTWPIKGAATVREHLVNYRDAVEFVHRETVRCINEGKTADEAVAEVKLPERLAKLPYLQENYGRVEWSVRGLYHGYKGWYDGRGTGLYPLPPARRDRELVALAGGANNILARAIELQKAGEHQLCLELCDVVIQANPDDRLAHRVKAESLKQLAFSIPNLNTFGFYRSAYAIEMEAAGIKPGE
jgi:alkyl sulfatase BDS1-like metallo-beta-lactamase superfamily hydrolase